MVKQGQFKKSKILEASLLSSKKAQFKKSEILEASLLSSKKAQFKKSEILEASLLSSKKAQFKKSEILEASLLSSKKAQFKKSEILEASLLSSKKAQMKIQQMAFMLIAVTIFFILVGMFFLVFKVQDIKQSVTNIEEQNARGLAMKIANSPEMSCGRTFLGEQISNCIDGDKLMMLKKNIDEYKFDSVNTFWGKETNIEVLRLYPKEENVECTIETYPDCNRINLLGEQINNSYENFVLLCWKKASEGGYYDQCDIAKIMIDYKKWDADI